MKPSFKQFNSYVSLREEELTEETLNEIFGMFKGAEKSAADREALIKKMNAAKEKLEATKKEWNQAKEAAEKKKEEKVERPRTVDSSSAAGGRAAELDWINSKK